MYGNTDKGGAGTTKANNMPVGTAGQPMNKTKMKSEAISRRMKKRQDSIRGKTN